MKQHFFHFKAFVLPNLARFLFCTIPVFFSLSINFFSLQKCSFFKLPTSPKPFSSISHPAKSLFLKKMRNLYFCTLVQTRLQTHSTVLIFCLQNSALCKKLLLSMSVCTMSFLSSKSVFYSLYKNIFPHSSYFCS